MKKTNNIKQDLKKEWNIEGSWNRFHGFQELMRYRIRDILLVSSLYDLYLFEEDGRLYELIRSEYFGLNLSHSPELLAYQVVIRQYDLQKKRKDLT